MRIAELLFLLYAVLIVTLMFQAQTNDVISILVGIFECLHQSFSAPREKYSGENWDCTSDECLAHTIIGMNLLERISCCYCGLESGNEQFTSFLRMVDESKLRRMKACLI